MWSKEIAEDSGDFFYSIDPENDGHCVGDVFIFQGKSLDPRSFHLALNTGQYDTEQDLLLLHASFHTRCSTIWPVREFLANNQYDRIVSIKRLVSDLHYPLRSYKRR